ncbi:MAG: cyclase family protein [bacterium]|nr:cyclase family protein [bacterium]
MIYDISLPLSESTPVYPGDRLVQVDRVCDVARGDKFSLSEMAVSLHAGTHIDAPSHYIAGAASIEAMDLSVLTGDAMLVDMSANGAITADALDQLDLPPETTRLLLRTNGQSALGECGAKWLVGFGVKLVGIDGLSIGVSAQCNAVHRTLLEVGIIIVESLDLSVPPAGQYQLICLPLNIAEAEAAPARAILIA